MSKEVFVLKNLGFVLIWRAFQSYFGLFPSVLYVQTLMRKTFTHSGSVITIIA